MDFSCRHAFRTVACKPNGLFRSDNRFGDAGVPSQLFSRWILRYCLERLVRCCRCNGGSRQSLPEKLTTRAERCHTKLLGIDTVCLPSVPIRSFLSHFSRLARYLMALEAN